MIFFHVPLDFKKELKDMYHLANNVFNMSESK